MKEKIMKSHVGFRTHGWAFGSVFFDAIERLNANESEFIRMCIENGFTAAVAELGLKRRQQLKAMQRARKRIERPFDWAAAEEVAADYGKAIA